MPGAPFGASTTAGMPSPASCGVPLARASKARLTSMTKTAESSAFDDVDPESAVAAVPESADFGITTARRSPTREHSSALPSAPPLVEPAVSGAVLPV